VRTSLPFSCDGEAVTFSFSCIAYLQMMYGL
jgi:hypothetical protein